MTKISIIVAIDKNNAIGKDNGMLCHLPDDLKYFKRVTSGNSVIMGRKTFESLPKGALPNRRNIVISRNPDLQFAGCEMVQSTAEALGACEGEDEVFVMGGGIIYNEMMELADKLHITHIHNAFAEADTFFPIIDSEKWSEVWREDHSADEKHAYSFSFVEYLKK